MPRPPRTRPALSSRKQPRQARSTQMVADILEASIRVLRREGGHRFNTIRVAREAGVSVGSLYQYFPNKEALLFRLQLDEWQATMQLLAGCLGQRHQPPAVRLRHTILEFFRTEAEEADLRRALDDASALYRGSPEARAQEQRALALVEGFFAEALPRRPRADIAFAAQFFVVALAAIAEKVTDRVRDPAALARWADATADLLCAQLEGLQRPRPRHRRPYQSKRFSHL
jgi:AcrR family transcriptional regulator